MITKGDIETAIRSQLPPAQQPAAGALAQIIADAIGQAPSHGNTVVKATLDPPTHQAAAAIAGRDLRVGDASLRITCEGPVVQDITVHEGAAVGSIIGAINVYLISLNGAQRARMSAGAAFALGALAMFVLGYWSVAMILVGVSLVLWYPFYRQLVIRRRAGAGQQQAKEVAIRVIRPGPPALPAGLANAALTIGVALIIVGTGAAALPLFAAPPQVVIAPTETPTPERPTPTPTTTPTPTPTITPTPVPPTNTPVPPSATPAPPTNTPVPPSATPAPPTSTPVPPPTSTPVPPPPLPPGDPAREQAVVSEINRVRAENGCGVQVVPVDALTAAARRQSIDMAANDFVGHDGTDGSTPTSRMRDVGYVPNGWYEVAAAGSSDAGGAVNQWMNSTKGHREAILDCAYFEIGVGYAANEGGRYTHYWVAILTRGRR